MSIPKCLAHSSSNDSRGEAPFKNVLLEAASDTETREPGRKEDESIADSESQMVAACPIGLESMAVICPVNEEEEMKEGYFVEAFLRTLREKSSSLTRWFDSEQEEDSEERSEDIFDPFLVAFGAICTLYLETGRAFLRLSHNPLS